MDGTASDMDGILIALLAIAVIAAAFLLAIDHAVESQEDCHDD